MAGRMRRCGAVLSAAVVLVTAGSGVAHAAEGYDRQLDHGSALYQIAAPDHGGAQEFSTDAGRLTSVSVFLVSKSTVGTVDVSVRTAVDDPASAVATAHLDLAGLGGTGSGWVRVPLDATIPPDVTHYLAVSVSGADGSVVWQGSTTGSGLASWNYDAPYWGGWHRETARHLAFAVNDVADCAADNTCFRHLPTSDLSVYTAGLLGNADHVVALSPLEAAGAAYVPGSDVLRLPDGRLRYLPAGAAAPVTVPADDPGAAAAVRESRAWLAAGRVPGRTARDREMSARALLDLRLLTQPNGAVAAAWYGAWAYSWPRDASFVSVALARTGHLAEAYRILRFTAGTQRADGTWDARTTLDGAGPPDDRQWQLDGNGWVPWALWQWVRAGGDPDDARALYPTMRRAADYAAASLDDRGLPPASPDYWEIGTDAPNLGTAAPLLAGLRSATDLARRYGRPDDARRWQRAADRLSDGIAATFGANGYQRTIVDGSGLDSAVAFLAPPFTVAPRGLDAALQHSFDALRRANGGVVPGEDWQHAATWTPETMFFALAWSGTGRRAQAAELVDWLAAHRTVLGALPEQVDESGHPSSVAPLAWTDSLALLTLTQLDGHRIPVPRG
ncbi:MAG TPA: glycoside hydrolase family 15 protein [Actinocatenispora sp.]